ncbi:MAG: 4Fe-4S dicluster domain-containing protein [Planctomycetota bacterium]|nr:4Fe-4S dicluster domain-containing protein [Planctomycetota bacterium]
MRGRFCGGPPCRPRRVFVPEPWLGHIQLGEPVKVRVDSFPGRDLAGTVEQIARAAEFTPRNVQTVGEARLRKGGEMSWLKIVPYRQAGEGGRVGFLPMMCQHCDAAPCEPVCPVYASVHNEEGLNAQIYNRCIGTRYCANNYPYKVRRFNWLDHAWAKPLDLQLNPDVSVRRRGVMEKCTFCIQRIREVQWLAKREKRRVRDGEVAPACVASCPAGAFVFGDLLDEESKVSQLTRHDARRYHVLEHLNTKPGVTYLKRIRQKEIT